MVQRLALLFAPLLAAGCATAALAATPEGAAMDVAVDLRDAPRKLFRATLEVPARPGPLSLVYPKWIPGEHGPTGPITDLAGLRITAGERLLPWRRDPIDMYRIDVDVPEGARSVTVALEFFGSPVQDGFSGGASSTANLAVLSWNHVLLYPRGISPARLTVRPSLQLPAGWTFSTSLAVKSQSGGRVEFAPTTLELLVDSPVQAGRYQGEFPLAESRGAKVSIAVAAETAAEATPRPQEFATWKRLVAEEAALFGARHFDSYRWLLTSSDSIATFGLEHHQSSDDRVQGRALLEKEFVPEVTHLLAHESVHSWNGKFRRPAGLATPDYQQPMDGSLLWVYEGLTEYLGTILTARAGGFDGQMLRDYYASIAEAQRNTRGRLTRPLADTAVAAQLLYFGREGWSLARRSVDFYSEGDLIWLEVDATLRELTGGAKSLDDFCRAFYAGDGGPEVKPYTADDVFAALNAVAPHDWRALFEGHLRSTAGEAPLEGLLAAGWKLDYSEQQSEYAKNAEKATRRLDLRSSIGVFIDVDKERNVIVDVVPGKAADLAGLAPGMKLIAVNGRRFSPEGLVTAVEQTKSAGAPLALLVENADTFQTLPLDYKEGLKYPRLSRVEGRPDRLAEIARPLVR